MDTGALRREHQTLIQRISRLGGLATDLKTRGDAHDVRAQIQLIDTDLQAHLMVEDTQLYPALIEAGDAAIRALGINARQDMGGFSGAWAEYRDHWTIEAMLGNPRRFTAATVGVLGALSLRIATENDILYPAAETLADARLSAA